MIGVAIKLKFYGRLFARWDHHSCYGARARLAQ